MYRESQSMCDAAEGFVLLLNGQHVGGSYEKFATKGRKENQRV